MCLAVRLPGEVAGSGSRGSREDRKRVVMMGDNAIGSI
jgi:hypothetical protein